MNRGFGLVAACLILIASAVACDASASAQGPKLEIGVGAGHAAAKGEPPPDLWTVDWQVAAWPWHRFGIAWSGSYGPAEVDNDLPPRLPFPNHAGDRVLLKSRNLLHQRATFRYRRPLLGRLTIVGGAGLLLRAQWEQSGLLAVTLTDIHEYHTTEKWQGLAFEALAQVALAEHASLQFGIVIDKADDRTYRQPILGVNVGF